MPSASAVSLSEFCIDAKNGFDMSWSMRPTDLTSPSLAPAAPPSTALSPSEQATRPAMSEIAAPAANSLRFIIPTSLWEPRSVVGARTSDRRGVDATTRATTLSRDVVSGRGLERHPWSCRVAMGLFRLMLLGAIGRSHSSRAQCPASPIASSRHSLHRVRHQPPPRPPCLRSGLLRWPQRPPDHQGARVGFNFVIDVVAAEGGGEHAAAA